MFQASGPYFNLQYQFVKLDCLDCACYKNSTNFVILFISVKNATNPWKYYFEINIQISKTLQAKLAFERLPIPKAFHPFVCGPNKENIIKWQEETNAKISVPPHKDEIVVSGEKEGVLKCKAAMMAIYEVKVMNLSN